MSAVTRPRGPLPPRVYWIRRAVVLAVAFVLVLAIGRLLGSGSDGRSDEDDSAAAASGEQTTRVTDGTPKAQPTRTGKKKQRVLAQPDGPCDAADITVEPLIERAANDGSVPIRLALTGKDAACTWTATEKSVVVRISSGNDAIWSSQQCPTLAERDVVVRSAARTVITMTWNGRRSDEKCSHTAGWARPGYYHVTAAALGGEPSDVQFRLTRPPAVRVTVTPTPKQKSSTKPSGAVEPDRTRG